MDSKQHRTAWYSTIPGSVAELADALDLGSSTARCAGSIPVTPTCLLQLIDKESWRDSLDAGVRLVSGLSFAELSKSLTSVLPSPASASSDFENAEFSYASKPRILVSNRTVDLERKHGDGTQA